MLKRYRLKTPSASDPRPVKWPPPHPYWVTGYGDDCAVIVFYADSEEQVLEHWPDAYDLDGEECDGYTFTDRFPRPDWFADAT